MRSHSRGDFRHPHFQNVFVVRKDDDDDDDGRSLLAERRNKTKDQNEEKERAKETRKRDVNRRKEWCACISLLFVPFL